MKHNRQLGVVLVLCCFITVGLVLFFGLEKVFAADDEALKMDSGSIIISEIYPHPQTGEVEFVELKNISSGNLNLNGWKICDKLGSVQCNVFEVMDDIEPNQYLAFNLSPTPIGQHRIYLNDDGDIVELYDNNNLLIFSTEPNYCNESLKNALLGQSYNYDVNSWYWAEPTPNAENNLKPVEIIQQEVPLNIEEAREKTSGEEVVVTGTVTTLPGVLSSQYFYIQDETGGIQVYCYGKIFPSLILGDSVSVTGELSEVSNERRLKIDGIDNIVILNHTDPIVPKEIAISDIGEKNEGTYVKTAGIVTETSGDTFFISDGVTEIKVMIRKSTGIEKPKMKKGDQVEITGIVSQYKNEYRILPIDQDDVKIVASDKQLPRAGNEEFIYFFISLLSTVLWNIYLETKRKHIT